MLPGLTSPIIGRNRGIVQFVGSKVVANIASGTIDLTSGLTGGTRSGVAAGDLVVVFRAGGSDGGSGDMAVEINDGSVVYTEIGTGIYADDTDDADLYAAYKFMGSSPDSTVNFDAISYSFGIMTGIAVFARADPAVLDVAAVQASGINAAHPNAGAITPETQGSIIIVAGASSHGSSSTTFTTPSDLTNFKQGYDGGTNGDCTFGFGLKEDWTSGAFDPAAWVHSVSSTSNSWAAMTIAIRPE